MQIETNINGDRIEYECNFADALDKSEKELYWSTTQKAEDAIARICDIQERRVSEDGDIRHRLLPHHFDELAFAIDDLNEAMMLLDLIERAADWSKHQEEWDEGFAAGLEAAQEVTDSNHE
ncbi:hypothetical protein [Natronococcus wangiae]|uniref:hypothetical protein n=1 Tax=Natronococcus wangiae TaxID=3068275 RepID=UPI00273DD914|nr:hypothetical protein [Natronococcus sp. AD5]